MMTDLKPLIHRPKVSRNRLVTYQIRILRRELSNVLEMAKTMGVELYCKPNNFIGGVEIRPENILYRHEDKT